MSRVALGVVRQSSTRDGNAASRDDQAKRIELRAHELGAKLAELFVEKPSTSGRKDWSGRPALLAAVEYAEANPTKSGIVLVDDSARLARNTTVAKEAVERIEAAGWTLETVNGTRISRATAESALVSGTLSGFDAYYADLCSERTKKNQARKRASGEWLGGRINVGTRVVSKRLEADPETAPAILEAFKSRERGDSLSMIRIELAEAGIELVESAVAKLLTKRVYVETGIVPADLFRRVNATRVPRGKRAPSDALLARLGVLVCGTTGQRMSVGSAPAKRGETKRSRTYTAKGGQSIMMELADAAVAHAVRCALRDRKGSTGVDVDEISASVERKRSEISALVAVLDPSIPGAVERMESEREELARLEDELQSARDAAGFSLSPSLDWPTMTREGRRDLIRALVVEARVLPVAAVGTKRIEDGTDPDGNPILVSPRVAVTIRGEENVQTILDTEARELREELAEVLAREPYTLDDLRPDNI